MRPDGNFSNQAQFASDRSSLAFTECECLETLQDKELPECLTFSSPNRETQLRKSTKELSLRSGPPLFSSLLSNSLKSPVNSHASSLVANLFSRRIQKELCFQAVEDHI